MANRTIARPVAPLLFAAMAIFLITVTIGILNGTDLVDFPHGAILAHVHSGTLGWITLSIFAATAWIFGADRLPVVLRNGAIAAVALYVAAFWADIAELRPIAGVLMLTAIVWFAVWAFGARAGRPLTVPGLSMLLAMINLVIGGVLGVLLGLMLAGAISLPSGIAGAHPAMMVAGYLILAGVALDEQLLEDRGARELTRGGKVQAYLFFLAGIALAVGILFDILPLLGVNLLFEVVGVAIALVRNWGAIAGVGWGASSPRRHGAASLLYLVPGIGLLGYLIVTYSEDIEAAPRGLFIALDHAIFIGVLTNAILGLLLVASAPRRAMWAWADQLVFWGVNLGVAGFLVGLVGEIVALKRIATPIMGAAILLGLLTAALRMREGVEPGVVT